MGVSTATVMEKPRANRSEPGASAYVEIPITGFLKMRSTPSRTFVKLVKFSRWSLRSSGASGNHSTCDKNSLEGCLGIEGGSRQRGFLLPKGFPWLLGAHKAACK